MLVKHAAPRIIFPKTINDALLMKNNEPEAVVWAGGTSFSYTLEKENFIHLPRTVVSLSRLEELTRIHRSENGLDIGAAATLEDLLAVGNKILPAGLPDVLLGIGSLPLRSQATIGGNLGLSDFMGDLRPSLHLLGSLVETRLLRKGRRGTSISEKIPIAKLYESNRLAQGALITRITIPSGHWNYGHSMKIYRKRKKILQYTTIARIEKSVLTEWRMAISNGMNLVVRDQELEMRMAGKALPLKRKDLSLIENTVNTMMEGWNAATHDIDTIVATAGNISYRKAHSSGRDDRIEETFYYDRRKKAL